MKILILIFISLNCFGNYALKSEIDSGSSLKVYTRKPKSGNYLKIPKGFNLNYHVIVDEMINDYDSPINSKSETETCVDQSDCEAKNLVKTCLDQDERVLMAQDFSDIYCSKITGYNQKLNGNEIVVEDAAKKETYLQQKQDDKIIEDTKSGQRMTIRTKIIDDGWGSLTNAQKTRMMKHLLRNLK